MHDAAELERLIAHIGPEEARRIAGLARTSMFFPIPRAAHAALGEAVKGYGGRYGEAAHAGEALRDLLERFDS